MNGSELLTLMGASAMASPAAAVWLASSGMGRAMKMTVRIGGVVLVLAAVAMLLLWVPSRQTASALWLAFCVIGGAAVAIPAALSTSKSPSLPAPGWGGKTLVMIIPLAVVVPSLVFFVRLLSAGLLGGLLARLDPQVLDSSFWENELIADFLWVVPAGVVFTALSLRRGRLGSSVADLGRAVGAWVFFLGLRGLVVSTGLGFLRTQTIGVPGFEVWSDTASFWFHSILIAVAVPVTLHVAWGRGRSTVRLATAAALLVAAAVNLGLLLGLTGAAQFATARVLERRGELRSSLDWYAASLRSDPSPELTAYLQHRISLIHYKLGRVELAREGFGRLASKRRVAPDLASQARLYMKRLEQQGDGSDEGVGRRVVLEGVEVPTEARAAYCAPNTLGLVFRYFGSPMSVAEIGEQAALVGAGTSLPDLGRTVERQGFDFLVKTYSSLDDIRWLIDRGLPALVFTPRHVLAVFGYDDRLATAVCYDTQKWDIWVDRPYPELLSAWGQRAFMLGVVLPREGGGPEVEEARQRFGGPGAEAAWQWILETEGDGSMNRMARLQRAVLTDPTFFPAIFEVLERRPENYYDIPFARHPVAWLEDHARMDDALAEARELLDRQYAPELELASGIADWYSATGQWQELMELATDLSDRGKIDLIRKEAGIAAVEVGELERAAFLLEPLTVDDDTELETLDRLLDAHFALGQEDAAADDLSRLAPWVADDQLDEIMALGTELGRKRGPDYLAGIQEAYLDQRPEDVEMQLDLAGLSLEIAEDAGDDEALENLQRARRAALFARGLASDDAVRKHAEELLQEVEARLDERLATVGDG